MKNLLPATMRLRRLAAEDRAWVLGRLAPEERARVEPLLAQFDHDRPETEPAVRQPVRPAPEDRLNAADPEAVSRILADQPDHVLVPLLSGRWSWRPRFLKSLPRSRRRALDRATHDGGDRVRPAVRAALTEVLADLVALPSTQPTSHATSGAFPVLSAPAAHGEERPSAAADSRFESALAEAGKPRRRRLRRRR